MNSDPHDINIKSIKKLKLKGKKNVVKGAPKIQKIEKIEFSSQINGEGRIVSTQNTVQGFNTKFAEECQVGDYISLVNPLTHIEENKQIAFIVSNRCLTLDDPFSTDIITTTEYQLKKGVVPIGERVPQKKKKYVYVREKSGIWSYKTVRKETNEELTAEEALNIRAKSGRDKYCW